MFFKWLKRKLGIDALEKKLELAQSEKTNLEVRVVEEENSRKRLVDSLEQPDFNQRLYEFLSRVNLNLSCRAPQETQEIILAEKLVQQYGLKRFSPPPDDYPTEVISMDELRRHPEKYYHKLAKGVFNFPVGLNFSGVNHFFDKSFGNFSLDGGSKGELHFAPNTLFKYDNSKIAQLIVKCTNLAELNKSGIDSWVFIEPTDFLANYDGLVGLIAERPELSKEQKELAIKGLSLARFTYLTALEIVAKSRIKDPAELLQFSGHESYEVAVKPEGLDALKKDISDSLLRCVRGTCFYSIQRILPIRSKGRFVELCSLRTAEILSKDKERKGLTATIDKPLAEYSIGESVTMACYFARNVIQNYANLEDLIQGIFEGKDEKRVTGRCTDYAGLALHYLREYLVPLNPEKFRGWSFGLETEEIGSYGHAYLKVVHVLADRSVDVYFIDPTKLAGKGIKALKTPENILKYTDTGNLPVQIKRDAEDLLFRPIK